MRLSVTGSGKRRQRRTYGAALAAVLVTSGSMAGLPPAYAVTPPVIDPAAVPADGAPGPVAPMKQNAYCAEVSVLPGTDFKLQPKYMDMLNIAEAWKFSRGAGVKVAVIDTGVTPHPRFLHLTPGGDYVMSGDGLSDCDAHGTIVASMIGAAPSNDVGPLPEAPRKPVTIPTTEAPSKPPPPQTITLSPLPQTVTVAPSGDQDQPVAPPQPVSPPAPGPAAGPAPDQPSPAGPAAGPGPVQPPSPSPEQPPAAPGAANHGRGTVTIPSYGGGARFSDVNKPTPLQVGVPHPPLAPPAPPAPPVPTGPDAFSGIAPDVEIISIRQSSAEFGLKDPYTGDQDPQTQAKINDIQTMARAIVHAANMGAQVINISNVTCMSSRDIVEQRALGAAVRYASVDKNAVVVTAAGDSSTKDCKQNPIFDPLKPGDPRDWGAATTVVTPSWFSDYVLTVGAVDINGQPLTQGQSQNSTSIAGPWVGIAAPGVDVVSLSPRDNGLINAIDGPDNTQLVPAGTSFATAIVSGVAALVRSRFPQLSSREVIDRLQRTARPSHRGVDNQTGFGVVDPVAALTWDVPNGPPAPMAPVSTPLPVPKPPVERNMVPVWVASGGLAAAMLIAGATYGTTVLMRRSRKRR